MKSKILTALIVLGLAIPALAPASAQYVPPVGPGKCVAFCDV